MILSILITYHNEKELLAKCINSIESQLEKNCEIIVYDDASTFPAKNYIPSSSIARLIRGEKNIGPAKGRNYLLREAKGEYIHYHDSDDWFESNWFSEVKKVMLVKSYEAIFTEVSSFKNEKLFSKFVLGTKDIQNDLLAFCIEFFMLVPAGTYQKKLVQKIGGYNESLWQSEDYDFHIRMALEKPTYHLIKVPLVNILLREESRSQNKVETSKDTLRTLTQLQSKIPISHLSLLADKAAHIGSLLYRMGQKDNAREAFLLSKQLGKATFKNQNKIYQLIAKTMGQEVAEGIALFYRYMKRA